MPALQTADPGRVCTDLRPVCGSADPGRVCGSEDCVDHAPAGLPVAHSALEPPGPHVLRVTTSPTLPLLCFFSLLFSVSQWVHTPGSPQAQGQPLPGDRGFPMQGCPPAPARFPWSPATPPHTRLSQPQGQSCSESEAPAQGTAPGEWGTGILTSVFRVRGTESTQCELGNGEESAGDCRSPRSSV